MTAAEWQEVFSALAGASAGPYPGSGLCAACRDVLLVTGVGITLMTAQHQGQLCVTDDVTASLEELQYTLGEGPSVDASSRGQVVDETDLAAGHRSRWPAFSAAATGAGIRAVFAFPLGVGAARIGCLTLYQSAGGPLPGNRRTAALVAADVVTTQVIALQAGAAPGALADGLADAGSQRAEVHQASGMISVQLGISVGEALIRLRSHAYAEERPIGEVAADVVGRHLRLDR